MIEYQIFKTRAESYIHQKRIPFFDFFRKSVFGFVLTDEKKGYYTLVTFVDDTTHVCRCNCKSIRFNGVCEHGLALILLANNWPFSSAFLPDIFDEFPLNRFFQKASPKQMRQQLDQENGPKLTAEAIPEVSERYFNYLFGKDTRQAIRDAKVLNEVVQAERSDGEKKMIQKGVSSRKCLYEDSFLNRIAKICLFLHRRESLEICLEPEPGHRVSLIFTSCGTPFFLWRMTMAQFLEMGQDQMGFWQKHLEIQYQPIALPIVYQMTFGSDNQLLIAPGVDIDHEFVPLGSLEKVESMYFHQKPGYFYTQTTLSGFELAHASRSLTEIKSKAVAKFLKTYQDDIRNLDQKYFDQTLSGTQVFDLISKVKLNFTDVSDSGFQATIQIQLGTEWYQDRDMAPHIKTSHDRYWNFRNRFFDSQSSEGQFLNELFTGFSLDSGLTMNFQMVFKTLFFFQDRVEIDLEETHANDFARLTSMVPEKPVNLKGSNLDLWPYQQKGLEWLWFLYQYGLGGLLCDQMGLGKTHQAMGLMTCIFNQNPHCRTLVICPRSVLYHWQEKLNTFCPELSIYLFHGTTRDADQALDSNVILTTYSTLRSSDPFPATHFELVIFDEIQMLKNRETQVHQSLKRVRGNCRIGLTGTPLENSLSDLKSLMDMVLPGYLGSESFFRNQFEIPIIRYGSQKALSQFKSLTKPFILRRSKSEVLVDLPEKTEDILSFDLLSWEREQYHLLLEKGRKELYQSGSPEFLNAFQLINQLKQFCNHPALYFRNNNYSEFPSQKWSLFTEILQQALDADEKIVVFTQYLGMIDFFKQYLQHHQIPFACITGSVSKRAEEQQRFQTDPACRVFLGTITAAGMGIDLTAATTLIHYDRWWNPAREEQATDRIHRIGQKKNVQIFKLLARNTIEERINALIESKRELLEDVVDFDSQMALKKLTMDDLLAILK